MGRMAMGARRKDVEAKRRGEIILKERRERSRDRVRDGEKMRELGTGLAAASWRAREFCGSTNYRRWRLWGCVGSDERLDEGFQRRVSCVVSELERSSAIITRCTNL